MSHYFKKLKNKNGLVLSLLVYSALTLMIFYGIGNWYQSLQHNREVKIHYDLERAEYYAIEGIEKSFIELKNTAFRPSYDEGDLPSPAPSDSDLWEDQAAQESAVPFYTHRVDTAESDYLDFNFRLAGHTATVPGTGLYGLTFQIPTWSLFTGDRDLTLVADLAYRNTDNDHFQAKIYKHDGDYYILSKGNSHSVSRLYAVKIRATSLFDYVGFFSDDAALGQETIEANGAKIHANGDILFDEYLKINDIRELSTAGKFQWGFSPFVRSDDYSTTTNNYPMLRWPFFTPNNAAQSPTLLHENYTNMPDGHFAGDRYGLYMYDDNVTYKDDSGTVLGSGPGYVEWDPASGKNPIWPWPGISAFNAPNGFSWDSLSSERAYVYQEGNVNCAVTDVGHGCAKDGNNEYFYAANVNINNTYIPNRFSSTYNDVYKYIGHNTETIDGMNLADSKKQHSAFMDFIDSTGFSFDANNKAVGLEGILKDAYAGGEYISPPKIDVGEILYPDLFHPDYLSDPDTSVYMKEGLSVQKYVDHDDNDKEYIQIMLNGQSLTTCLDTQGCNAQETGGERFAWKPDDPVTNLKANDIGCGDDHSVSGVDENTIIFQRRSFMNALTGQRDQVLRVNMAALKACIDSSDEPLKNGQSNGNGFELMNGTMVVNFEGKDDANGDGVIGEGETSHLGLALYNAQDIPQDGMTFAVGGDLILEGDFDTGAQWEPAAAIVTDQIYLVSDNFTYPETLPVTNHEVEYPLGRDIDGHTFEEGTGYLKDVATDGYNWLAEFDPDNPSDPNFKRPEQATGGTLIDSQNGGTYEHYYNISLIGQNAWNPQFLQLWKYHDDPTLITNPDPTIAASSWTQHYAILNGSFIQLSSAQLPSKKAPFAKNNRACDQSGAGYGLAGGPPAITRVDTSGTLWTDWQTQHNFVCRNSEETSSYDLLTTALPVEKRYDDRMRTTGKVPPGDLVGIEQAFMTELKYEDNGSYFYIDNWNFHPTIFSGIDHTAYINQQLGN